MAAGDGDGDDPFNGLPFTHISHPLDRLTDQERAEVESYTLGGFERINAALRGQLSMTASLDESIAILRTAIRKFRLGTDVRVTREIGAADVGLSAPADSPGLVGRVFAELGFLSASMNADPPHSSARQLPIDLELRVPAGTPALAVGSLSDFPLERELLVIDARRIFVVESRYDDATGRWRLYGAVLSEGEL